MNKKDNVIKGELFRLASNDLLGGAFSIGLFTIDKTNNTVTMKPGVYTLHESVTFGIHSETKIVNFECKPLINSECSAALNESAAAHHHTADIGLLRGRVKKET